MNPLSWFNTAESTLRSFEVISILAGLLTVGALIGQVFAGRIVTAQAREKTGQIQALVEWRTLSAEQIGKLNQILSQKPSVVKFTYVSNDPEALFFAIELSKGFTNWNVLSGNRSYTGTLVFGLRIVGESADNVRLVKDAFSAAGIAISDDPIPGSGIEFRTLVPNEPQPTVEIIVGSKPRPMP